MIDPITNISNRLIPDSLPEPVEGTRPEPTEGPRPEPVEGTNLRCTHPYCTRIAIRCTLQDYDTGEELDEYYCPVHAPRHGYCALCGRLDATVAPGQFGDPCTLCPDCQQAISDHGHLCHCEERTLSPHQSGDPLP